MKRRALLILFLLIPSVSALELTGLEFLEFESHGRPIGAISTGRVPNIDMKMVIRGEDFVRLTADVSGLNRNDAIVQERGYENMVVQSSSCQKENDTYTCYIRRLLLLLSSDTVTIPITLYNDTNSTLLEEVYIFELDDTAPRVTFIGTEACLEDTCYIPSGVYAPIKIQFEDEKGTFEKRLIRYSLAGAKHFVHTCDGQTCYARAKTTCSSGQRVTIKIIPDQTMDDAYNKVSNSLRRELVCDSKDPVVLSTKVESQVAEYVKLGDTMIITMNVSEDIGPVSGVANFSAFGGEEVPGSCAQEDEIWKCVFSSVVYGDDPYIGDVKITIRDLAGNTIEETVEQEILGLSQELEPDYWRISYDYSPSTINKQFMPYVNKKVYLHSTLSPKSGNVEVLNLRISDCKAENGTTYQTRGSPKLFNFDIGNKNPVAVFSFTQSSLPDEVEKIKFNCTLSIQTRKETAVGKFFVTNPEKEIVKLEINFANLERPEEQIRAEVASIQQKAQEWENKYGFYRDILTNYRLFCGGMNAMNVISGGLSTLGVSMQGFPPTKPAGQVVTKVGTTVGVVPDAAFSVPKSQGMCQIMLCKADFQTKATDVIGKLPGVEFMSKVAGYESYADFVNPDNSLVMSVLTMCLPSFMYNLQKAKAIDCEYLSCLNRDFLHGGFPLSGCAEMRTGNKCKFYVGEFFEVFPYSAIADDMMKLLKDSLSNPASLVGTSLSTFCYFTGGGIGGVTEGMCNIAASVSKVTKFLNSFSGVQNLQAKYNQPISVCDSILGSLDRPYDDRVFEPEEPAQPDEFCSVHGCKKVVGNTRYERVGDYYYVNGKKVKAEDVPSEIKNDLDHYHASWQQQRLDSLPATIREGYAEYSTLNQQAIDAGTEYNDAQSTYNDHRAAYSDYKGIGRWNWLTRPSDEDKQKQDEQRKKLAEQITGNTEASEEQIKTFLDSEEETVDGKKDDFKTKRKEADDKLKETNREAFNRLNWNSGDRWADYATALNSVRGFNQISNFLVDAGIMIEWRDAIDRRLHNAFTDKEYRKSVICDKKFSSEFPETAFTISGRIGTAVAAHVQAERTGLLENVTGGKFYTYTISGLVAPKKPGLEFKITLNPGEYKVYQNKTVENETISFVKDKMIILHNEKKYNKVCLEFEGNWKEYFDVRHSSASNKLCNSIPEVET